MKFLTSGLVNGELSDAQVARVRRQYRRHVRTILPSLPDGLKPLAELQLHDAIIERVVWQPKKRRAELTLVAPHAGKTWLAITVVYKGVLMGERRLAVLRAAARDRDTCVLESEIDFDGDIFSHRLLCYPWWEIVIDCRDGKVEQHERADGRVQLQGAFVER